MNGRSSLNRGVFNSTGDGIIFSLILAILFTLPIDSKTWAQNSPPVADMVARPTSGGAPLVVRFENTSYDPEGAALEYLWGFGDNRFSDEKNPTHEYKVPGVYIVRLSVRDGQISSDTYTTEIRVGCIRVTPGSHYFKNVEPGSTGSASLTLTNVCRDAKTVSGIRVKNFGTPVFATTYAPSLPFTLGAGKTAEVKVRFAPDATRFRYADLVVESDDLYTPQLSVSLSGGKKGTLFKSFKPVTTE
jgi:PKD repeat protein